MSSESSAPRSSAPGAGTMNREEALSALADGDAAALGSACGHWRDDARARATWHAYQLIGDVMRSDDLASTAGRDAAFLARLRTRLAQEPVPLAPAAPAAAAVPAVVHASHVRHLGWRAPAAVAAGFVAVAGVLVLTRGAPERGPTAAEPVMAAASSNLAVADNLPVSNGLPVRGALVRSGQMIRSPELDAYFRAHQSVRGGALGSPPGVLLRNVDLAVTVMPAEPRDAASTTDATK